MTDDVLAAARGLRGELDTTGRAGWSGEIDDAIAGGSTGTEILMRLRSVLTRLAPVLHENDPEIAAHVRAIATAIDSALTGSR